MGKRKMVTFYSLMIVAYFTSQDACQTWTNDVYSDVFGYVCFEVNDEYGQFYRLDYNTLEECKEASHIFYEKDNCFKGFMYGTKPPVPRPIGLGES